jgi:hypothetical protein
MNESHYGWVVNTHYDWVNMLIRMKNKSPERFNNFKYSNQTIYHYLDCIQQEQNLHD